MQRQWSAFEIELSAGFVGTRSASTFRELFRRFEHLDATFYTGNMVLATLKVCWYMNENGGMEECLNVINL